MEAAGKKVFGKFAFSFGKLTGLRHPIFEKNATSPEFAGKFFEKFKSRRHFF